jgi:hypothetical protein
MVYDDGGEEAQKPMRRMVDDRAHLRRITCLIAYLR